MWAAISFISMQGQVWHLGLPVCMRMCHVNRYHRESIVILLRSSPGKSPKGLRLCTPDPFVPQVLKRFRSLSTYLSDYLSNYLS